MINVNTLGKVGVLYGGTSAERDVSLMSGEAVFNALKARKVNAHLFDTGTHSLADLKAQNFDRVFIALHGRYGEDGCMQGVLEHLQIPYTGSGVLASALAMDKVMTKKIWLAEGIATPAYVELSATINPEDVAQKLGLPLSVKSAQIVRAACMDRVCRYRVYF